MVSVVLAAAIAGPASAVQLLTNGDFETGDFTGWTLANRVPGNGSFWVDDRDGATPVSGLPTYGPYQGAFYAVSDQTGPGTHALIQDFTVPGPADRVVLSFWMFVNSWTPSPVVGAAGLDHTGAPNQHGRVDLLSASAGDFDTGAGVLANFYLGADPGSPPHHQSLWVFDITGLVGGGGTFRLRFAETNNQNYLNLGIDNAYVDFRPVPEPTSSVLIAAGLVAFAAGRRRERG